MFGPAQPEQAPNRLLIEAEIRGVEGELLEWAGQCQRQLAHLWPEQCSSRLDCPPTTSLPEGALLQSMTEGSTCRRPKQKPNCCSWEDRQSSLAPASGLFRYSSDEKEPKGE